MIKRHQLRRGQILVMFALILPLLLGFAALAVDVVYALGVKAALVMAVDASALAGARSIANGQAAVTAAVNRTFTSNLPADKLIKGAASYSPNPPLITAEVDGSRSITITGTATSPTFLMGVFGFNGWTVKANAKAGRRDVNVIIVLDRSGSLVNSGSWGDVQAGANFFVSQFDDTRDKVGLVSFGTNSRVDYAPQTPFQTNLTTTITNMQARSGNFTNSALGLYLAYDQLKAINDPTRVNEIVYFTDGRADAMPGLFNVHTTGSPKCPTSPQEGVYFTDNDSGGGNNWGIFTLQPTFAAGTWPSPNDYTIIHPPPSGCSGLNSTGSNGPSLLSGSFNPTWTPSIGTAPIPTISANNPNPSTPGTVAVNLAQTTNGTNIVNMSENMLLDTARIARLDPLNIRILVIGLGNGVKTDILQRVANISPYTIAGQGVGLYIFAPDHTQLVNAFAQAASAVSHLLI